MDTNDALASRIAQFAHDLRTEYGFTPEQIDRFFHDLLDLSRDVSYVVEWMGGQVTDAEVNARIRRVLACFN